MKKILITANIFNGIGDLLHFIQFVSTLRHLKPLNELYGLIYIPAGNQPAVKKYEDWLKSQTDIPEEQIILILDSGASHSSYRSFRSLKGTSDIEYKRNQSLLRSGLHEDYQQELINRQIAFEAEQNYIEYIYEKHEDCLDQSPHLILPPLLEIMDQILQVSLPFERSSIRHTLACDIHDLFEIKKLPTKVIHELHSHEAIREMAEYRTEGVNYFMGINEDDTCIGIPMKKPSTSFYLPESLCQHLTGENEAIITPDHPRMVTYLSQRLMSTGYLPPRLCYVQLFILFAIKAHPEKAGWDFYLNPSCLRHALGTTHVAENITAFLSMHGIDETLCICRPDQSTHDARIRIFTEFNLEDRSYHSLQKISNLEIACAGDNSFIDALYAPALPFFIHDHPFKMDLNRELAAFATQHELSLLANYFKMLHTVDDYTLRFRSNDIHSKTIEILHELCAEIRVLKDQWHTLQPILLERFGGKYQHWLRDHIYPELTSTIAAASEPAPAKLIL